MYRLQASRVNPLVAMIATILMAVSMILAVQFTIAAKPAQAASCTVNDANSIISCSDGWDGGIGSIGGVSGPGSTIPGGSTTVSDPNTSVFVGNIECSYGDASGSNLAYPAQNPKTCYPYYGPSSPNPCLGTVTCNLAKLCAVSNGKAARDIIVTVVTKKILYTSGKKKGQIKSQTVVVNSYCSYPAVPVKPVPVTANASGYCAVTIYSVLYYTLDPSIARSGQNGSVSADGVDSGTAGSGGTLSDKMASPHSVGLKYATAKQLLTTCDPKDQKYDWKFTLPYDSTINMSKLGYYRVDTQTKYQKCWVNRYATWTKITDTPHCDTKQWTVYTHDRYTNTCLKGTGFTTGIDTSLSDYFDAGNCAPENGTVKCAVKNTTIGGQAALTAAGNQNTVNVMRNGKNVKVTYNTTSGTAINVTGTGVKNFQASTIKRKTDVVKNSDPYYPSPGTITSAEANSNDQYFRLLNASGDKLKFGTFYSVSTIGNTNYLQFNWASNPDANWQTTSHYKYTAQFKVYSGAGGTVSHWTDPMEKYCGQTADSATGTTVKAPKVVVLRSINEGN